MENYDISTRGCYCKECRYWSKFFGRGFGFCLKNINPDTKVQRVTTVCDFCSIGEEVEKNNDECI